MQISFKQLNEWNGWKAPAKQYLQASGETIQLSDVPKEHVAHVRALYEWVFEQFEGMHKADTHETNVLIAEYNRALSGGGKVVHARFLDQRQHLENSWDELRLRWLPTSAT